MSSGKNHHLYTPGKLVLWVFSLQLFKMKLVLLRIIHSGGHSQVATD